MKRSYAAPATSKLTPRIYRTRQVPVPTARRGDRDWRTAYGVVADRVNVMRLL